MSSDEGAAPGLGGAERWRDLMVLYLGQFAFSLGSGVSLFGMGVWMYLQTKSVSQFAMVIFCGALTGVLASPLAGVIVDRLNRRVAMQLSVTGSAMAIGTLWVLAASGTMQAWHVYPVSIITALFNTLQVPALDSATTLLVSRESLGRAGGLLQLGRGAAQILAPLLGGLLLTTVGLSPMLLLNTLSFVMALALLWLVRIPDVPRRSGTRGSGTSFVRELGEGLRYLRERPGLVALLAFFCVGNFTVGALEALVTPLMLGMATPEVLGRILGAGGVGMVVGSLAVVVWGGPSRRVRGILLAAGAQALLLVPFALSRSALLAGGMLFLFMAAMPVINVCGQAVWQAKVAPHVQGRVFALRATVISGLYPFAYALAGLAADHVFRPLMAARGPLVLALEPWLGRGEHRGVALLVLLLAALLLTAVAVGFTHRPLRQLESEVPDARNDPAPSPVLGA